ncbi:MAG: biotin/lipoyl-binding protein [Phycisphaerales bacterium]|nr:biotin/lipoyl-binding protein [Phycisphaerales bacterium]
MIRVYLIPLLAIIGVLFAVRTVIVTSKPKDPSLPIIEPPRAPFRSFVAGSGLIEASTQNIAIGTPVPGLVTRVDVVVGDPVKAGDPLFRLDDRDLNAQLRAEQAAAGAARSKVAELRAQPRPEELPPLEARVQVAEVVLADARDQLTNWEQAKAGSAVTPDEISRRRFAVDAAAARVLDAQAQLNLTRAGAWGPQVAVAEAEALGAEARADVVKTELERRIVRAPVSGRVLQVNIRAGEFASAGTLSTPLMLMGSVEPLHLRVDVDEHDAWRVKQGARAVAMLRGNHRIETPLAFVRFEPYVIPKRALTGESTERVDTRVLQVVFSFDRGDLPVFVGQQMDVFIEADPIDSASPAAADSAPGA